MSGGQARRRAASRAPHRDGALLLVPVLALVLVWSAACSGTSGPPTSAPGTGSTVGSIPFGAVPGTTAADGTFDCSVLQIGSDADDPRGSISRTQHDLCLADPHAPWALPIFRNATWTATLVDGPSWEVVVGSGTEPAMLTADDALAFCTALAGYLDGIGQRDVSIVVALDRRAATGSVPGGTTPPATTAGGVLAQKEPAGRCAPPA